MNEDIASKSSALNHESHVHLPIENLFVLDRLPSETNKLIMLACYAPIGSIIFCIRLFISMNIFFASCVLPSTLKFRRSILRFMCMICGIVVVESGERNETCKVIAANHVSPLDHTAVALCRPIAVPNVWNVPNLLSWIFGYTDMGASQGRNRLINNATDWCKFPGKPALFTLPETAMTNGKSGLLEFSTWPFSLNVDVQPCVIRVSRPAIADISVCRLGSRWWSDLLWFLFVPYTIISVKWLRPLYTSYYDSKQSCSEANISVLSKEKQMAQQCMQLIAHDLSINITKYTANDAVEYSKRVLLDQRVAAENEERNRQNRQQIAARRRNAEFRKQNTKDKSQNELDTMTFKVKEFFPTMPLWTIRKDIENTFSVAVTIDNFSASTTVSSTEIHTIDDVARVYKLFADECENVRILERWRMIEEQRLKYMNRKLDEFIVL